MTDNLYDVAERREAIRSNMEKRSDDRRRTSLAAVYIYEPTSIFVTYYQRAERFLIQS